MDEKTLKKIERIVLNIMTFYTAAMLVTAQIAGWSIYFRELIVVTTAAGWFVHIKEYKTHNYRARFIAVMAWANFVIYACHTVSFTSMLATMTSLIALLGIFCMPEIIYLGMGMAAVIFLFHGLVAKTISVTNFNEALRVLLHLLSVYAVSYVTWIIMHTRQEISEQLMDNIRELEIAEQSKDDFMVNVSHEIRTPINAVSGMSEAILQENLPESVRRDVIDIQTAGRNLLATVSNILDFSELENGKMELAEESYNITSTITDIINMALTLDNGKHLELIVDVDANLPSNLLGDEQKFRRIVLNLMDNAMKFTKEGGVILRIKGRKEAYGMNLIVSVKDSGIGMERTDVEKIFTSFSQVNSKRNREEGGVGLGLAITQALVRRMGGFITVKSTPGVGSKFMFTIPQKVLDETPIVSIRNRSQVFAACYFNMDKYNYSVIREGYENSIRHIAEQLGIMFRVCKNLAELKRRMDHENYTHVFISWEEYCEDRNFFEQLAKELTVVLILEYGLEVQPGSNMLRIYKPFTVLSIAAVFNGQKAVQNNEQHQSLHHRFIAPDAKVLVVDDNAMNLKVMARLLLPYQIKVSMASGGKEALDKIERKEYDCVFLDHMMPEMDGVETLHRIRMIPGAQALSVIAFTANAIGGAREMFISEGFDDFIAKPIELSVLERMLRRYIPVQKQIIIEENVPQDTPGTEHMEASKDLREEAGDAQGSSAEQNTDSSARPPVDEEAAFASLTRAGIDIEQGMTYCGDKEGFREITALFHTEGAKRKVRLQQCYEEQDWKNYVILVHALKSNAKGIGANELSEMALSLEMAGKENRIDFIFEHHEELMDRHDELLRSLAANPFLYPDGCLDETAQAETEKAGEDGKAGEPQMAADEPSLSEILARLKEKLESFESEGIEDILGQLAGMQYQETSLAELSEEIRDKVNEFDFLGAGDILSAWEAENI